MVETCPVKVGCNAAGPEDIDCLSTLVANGEQDATRMFREFAALPHRHRHKNLVRFGTDDSRRASGATVSFGQGRQVNLDLVEAKLMESLRSDREQTENGNMVILNWGFCEGDRRS